MKNFEKKPEYFIKFSNLLANYPFCLTLEEEKDVGAGLLQG